MNIDRNNVINMNNVINASYIIYTDGYITHARNGKSGTIDYSGTDAATVIQNAINALKSGGKIFINNGSYSISNFISVKDDILLCGAGSGTILVLNGGSFLYINGRNNVTILDLQVDSIGITGENAAINITDSTNVIINRAIVKDAEKFGITATSIASICGPVIIENCILNGRGNNDVIGGSNITNNTQRLKDIIIRNNIIRQDASIGNLYDGAIVLTGVYRTMFYNNITEGIVAFGAEAYPNKYSMISGNILKNPVGKTATQISAYTTADADTNATDLLFTNNIIENGHIAIYGVNTASDLKGIISNNTVVGVPFLGHPIDLRYCSNFIVTGNMASYGITGINLENSSYINVVGNVITNSTTGIDENSNCNNNIISNNIINNVTNKMMNISPTTIISNNMGYVTEANKLSDIFSIESTGLKTVTIAHGLDYIPNIQDFSLTVVKNTNVTDWAYDLLIVDSINATNVTVKINISRTSTVKGATAKLALRVIRI